MASSARPQALHVSSISPELVTSLEQHIKQFMDQHRLDYSEYLYLQLAYPEKRGAPNPYSHADTRNKLLAQFLQSEAHIPPEEIVRLLHGNPMGQPKRRNASTARTAAEAAGTFGFDTINTRAYTRS